MFAESLGKTLKLLVFGTSNNKQKESQLNISTFTLPAFMPDSKDNGFSITNTSVSFPEVKNPGNDPD